MLAARVRLGQVAMTLSLPMVGVGLSYPGLGKAAARLGAAGATAAAIGFLLDLEHVGWACAAALLVMRPAAEMQRLRSVGRIVAVVGGALAAIGLVRLSPSPWVYSLAAVAAVAAAGATHRSRWYVTPAFTTVLGRERLRGH